MADFKRKTLMLSSGKIIKLFGSSIAIGKSLEVGEGYAPNIFSVTPYSIIGKTFAYCFQSVQINCGRSHGTG